MRSGYMQCVPVISANIPCMYYIHRDIYVLWYVHVPRYVLMMSHITPKHMLDDKILLKLEKYSILLKSQFY